MTLFTDADIINTYIEKRVLPERIVVFHRNTWNSIMDAVIRKEQILDAARQLFYQYGYSKTSLEMIANECGVQKQLIAYYFGNKESLARAVYSAAMHDMFELVRFLTQSYNNSDILFDLFVSSIFRIRYFYGDSCAARFYEEFFCKSELSIEQLRSDFYNLPIENPELINEKRFVDYVMVISATKWLLYYYIRRDLQIPSDEFERQYIYEIFIRIMGKGKRITELFEDSVSLLSKYRIDYLPGFQFECKRID